MWCGAEYLRYSSSCRDNKKRRDQFWPCFASIVNPHFVSIAATHRNRKKLRRAQAIVVSSSELVTVSLLVVFLVLLALSLGSRGRCASAGA